MPDSFDKLPETLDTLCDWVPFECPVDRYTRMVEEGEIVEDESAEENEHREITIKLMT